ncbi:F-BAR domain only protein 1 isoform X1, partial [Silurus asotus]
VCVCPQGEKNAGFDVLYHNMKHGQIATKELAEFVRERAAIEETYSKSMSKLAKMASNGSPLGTFAPMWDLFRMSSDKVALCHMELTRKMNDLIRDLNKYGEEQVKVHRKTKEEAIGTLEAVQVLQVQNGHLQKAREGYHAKCMELERLRKEGAPQKELEKAELKSKKAAKSFAASVAKFNSTGGDFEQKMSESAQKFQDIEEDHLKKMKQLIKAYSNSIEDTHVQVGQVHEEFKQNVENIGIRSLIQKFTEQKGTGKDRPGPVGFEEFLSTQAFDNNKKSRAKAFRIPGLGKRDKEPELTDSALTDTPNSPLEVDDEGFMIRADAGHNDILYPSNKPCISPLSLRLYDKENHFYSSDSDYDDEEPKKFHIQIRPVCSRSNSAANELELKATVGTLSLPSNPGVRSMDGGAFSLSRFPRSLFSSIKISLILSLSLSLSLRLSSTASGSDSLFGPPLESAFKSHSFSGQEQLQTSECKTLMHTHTHIHTHAHTRTHTLSCCSILSRESAAQSNKPAHDGVICVRTNLVTEGKKALRYRDDHFGTRSWQRRWCFNVPYTKEYRSCSSSTTRITAVFSYFVEIKQPCCIQGCAKISVHHDILLGDTVKKINKIPGSCFVLSLFSSCQIDSSLLISELKQCLVKITGDLTLSFPAGIIRIFASSPNPPVLSFRLVSTARVDQFLPNQKLLYSDASQNDPNSKDFWFNMQALSVHLQREAELNPHASYYNVGVLKYQVSSQDPARAPLLLSAECQRSGTVTRVALDYHCCPATAPATQLTAVQVLLPLEPTATDLQCQPPATWNTEEKRLLWKLPNLSPTNHSKGSGTLCASWQCLKEPRGPAPSLAVQFVGTGASLSGLDMELVGGRYRMSLLKKRFATGKYIAGCLL